jgi:hypothetical protein
LWAAFITFDRPMIARRLQRRNRMFHVTARQLHGTLVAKSLEDRQRDVIFLSGMLEILRLQAK